MGVGPTTQDFVSENETNESPDAYYGSEENQYNVEGANTSAQDIVVSNNTTLDNYDYSNNRGYDPGQGSLQVQNGYQQQSDVLSCNYQTTTVVHAPKTALQVIYDEIDLLFAAGEITEAESAELHQLAFQGDLRVRDAIAQHSQGNSSLLVSLLHRDNDNLDLLYQRDMQYATYVQQTTQNYYNAPEVQPQAVYTYSSLYSYNQNPPQVVPAGVNPSSSIPNYTNATASSLQFNSTLPPLFYCDTFLCGLILKQTQTKLVFKKWKHCVFMLIPNALQLYQTLNDWKFRAYLEHYFDDHSQMVWEYGRWKDGQLGIDITFPKNRWISAVVWEAMSTKQQTGPILYDDFAGTLGYQVSARDNYYNNYCYQAWQHWGQGMGNPLLPGPIYNKDGKITFKSNRVRSHHLGYEGEPSPEWNYRVLISFVRHWGTYATPLDKQRKQFSSLYEITYLPAWANGWSATLGMGLDRGNYLGNSTGGILTIRKTGRIF